MLTNKLQYVFIYKPLYQRVGGFLF